jgi:hypothetical protein
MEAGTHEAQRSLGQRLLADEIIEADRLDPLAEGELVSTRVHDPQPIQSQGYLENSSLAIGISR